MLDCVYENLNVEFDQPPHSHHIFRNCAKNIVNSLGFNGVSKDIDLHFSMLGTEI